MSMIINASAKQHEAALQMQRIHICSQVLYIAVNVVVNFTEISDITKTTQIWYIDAVQKRIKENVNQKR